MASLKRLQRDEILIYHHSWDPSWDVLQYQVIAEIRIFTEFLKVVDATWWHTSIPARQSYFSLDGTVSKWGIFQVTYMVRSFCFRVNLQHSVTRDELVFYYHHETRALRKWLTDYRRACGSKHQNAAYLRQLECGSEHKKKQNSSAR